MRARQGVEPHCSAIHTSIMSDHDPHLPLREGVRRICADFPDEYWRECEAAHELMLTEVASLTAADIACAIPPMGIMIEVPAAALTARDFPVDFYSIGSNDLVQYTMAAARDNAALAPLADPLNPAVIELIRRTVEAAKAMGREVSLCGDMASTPTYIGALIDAGLTSLSCAPAQIGPVKLAISRQGAPANG